MSDSAIIVLSSDLQRKRALGWVNGAPVNTRIEFRKPRRTLPQNARFWAMLTDIAEQLTWHGKKLDVHDWKLVFLDALRREMKNEMRIVPSIDGTGFVQIGTQSSKLSVSEMADMMEIMSAFGAQHGVTFSEKQELLR